MLARNLHIASLAPVSFLRFLLPGEKELSAEQLLDATSNARLVHQESQAKRSV